MISTVELLHTRTLTLPGDVAKLAGNVLFLGAALTLNFNTFRTGRTGLIRGMALELTLTQAALEWFGANIDAFQLNATLDKGGSGPT